MDSKDGVVVALVYVLVAVLIFASDLVSLGKIEDIELAPMLMSLLLLVPLALWYRRARPQGGAPDSKVERRAVWVEVLVLFSWAMVVRVPFVLLLGMSFEKTPLIYLLALTVVLVKRADLRAFGFTTAQLGRSLLIGLGYYLVFACVMFSTLFIAVYAVTGRLVVVSYAPLPALLVFPFMTLCVGVSEEGLFRGFMQTRLSLVHSRRQALWAQAILFGLWHVVWHIVPFDPVGMGVHVASSLAFGWVFGRFFERSGTLVPLILAHGLVDTVGYGAVINPQLDPMAGTVQLAQAFAFVVGIVSLALVTNRLAAKVQLAEGVQPPQQGSRFQ
jgi:membrane protease YdiL (CAAX protease family)